MGVHFEHCKKLGLSSDYHKTEDGLGQWRRGKGFILLLSPKLLLLIIARFVTIVSMQVYCLKVVRM